MCTFLHDWWFYVQIQEMWLGDRRSEREAKAARQCSKKTASDKATLCCTKHRGRLSSIPLSCERRAGLHLCLLSSRKRVLEFNISKYTKAPKELTTMCVCTSAKNRVWVCRTWLCSEMRENSCSGETQQCRSWRYPNRIIWSKSIGRATHLSKDSLHEDGGTPLWQMHAIHGLPVNVPTELIPVRTLLPRLLSQVQMAASSLTCSKALRKVSQRFWTHHCDWCRALILCWNNCAGTSYLGSAHFLPHLWTNMEQARIEPCIINRNESAPTVYTGLPGV